MSFVSVTIAACLPYALASFTTPGLIRTQQIFVTSILAPEPTPFANLFVRSGFTKNCGYENGNLQFPLGCLPGYDCTHDGAASVSGCCATAVTAEKCELQTTCIDYTSNAGRSAPVPRAVQCDAVKPFCTTAYFIDNYAMFTCGNGQSASMVSAFYHPVSGEMSTSGTQSQPSGSLQPSSSPGQSSNTQSNDPSTSVAPIVGGVVGGVGGIGVVFIGFIFVRRSRRKDKKFPANGSSGGSVVELTKPINAQSQATELGSGDKTGARHFYSEMEAPRTVSEMPLGRAHYAHEAGSIPADASIERSELMGSDRREYIELDGQVR